MPSNRLSGRAYIGGPPPVCRRGPVGFAPLGPPASPPGLSAWARWTDLDPLAPAETSGILKLRRELPDQYWGSRKFKGVQLDLLVVRLPARNIWNVRFSIWDPWRFPETDEWPEVPVDPRLPFDSGWLTIVYVNFRDFREVRILA